MFQFSSAMGLLRGGLAIIYYPFWALASLVYSLFPLNVPFDQHFDSIASDESFIYHEIINKQQQERSSKVQWEQEKQRRDKIIQSVLKIWSFNKTHIHNVLHGENRIFSNKLKFDDPMVSYSNYDEWLVSFHTLSIIASAKIEDIVSIQHYDQLIVIKLKIRWMSPSQFINDNIFAGFVLNDVMVIKLDESNTYIHRIFEHWNGKRLLNLFGLIDIVRRITALLTLPFCYGVSFLIK